MSDGTTHGDEQSHAFRLALVRDPRFAATVNDIVVESGNALYQVYGAMHLQRRNLLSNYEPGESALPTIVSLPESAAATKVFTTWVNAHLVKLQADVASWGKPRIAIIRGTVLGAADFTF